MEERDVRAFVAVPVPAPLRERVAAIQNRLRGPAGVKWVDPDNFHFTLRFLGNVRPPVLDALEQALRVALAERQAFAVTLAGVGAFPRVTRPQTIWVGVTEGALELEDLARVVEAAVVRAGFPPEERPFRAHLTVGRVKVPRAPAELVQALEAAPADAEIGRMPVEAVVLMRSDLRRSGPIYTPLATVPLRQEQSTCP